MNKTLVSERLASALRQLSREEFVVFGAGSGAPTEADVAAFEDEVGLKLPDDFRSLAISEAAGLFVEVKPELWPAPKAGDVGPFWTFLNGVYVFGLAKELPEELDLRTQHANLVSRGHRLIPLLAVSGDADRWCLDSTGTLVKWNHETGMTEPEPLKFEELLLRELAALNARKMMMAHRVAADQKKPAAKKAPAKKAAPKKAPVKKAAPKKVAKKKPAAKKAAPKKKAPAKKKTKGSRR